MYKLIISFFLKVREKFVEKQKLESFFLSEKIIVVRAWIFNKYLKKQTQTKISLGSNLNINKPP